MSKELARRHLAMGAQALEEGELGKAEANFLIATQLEPTDSDAFHRLAVALVAQGKSDAALEALRRTLELDPKVASAYVLLASVYQRKGRFLEAIEASRQAIALEPSLCKPYIDIAKSKRADAGDAWLIDRLSIMAAEDGRSKGEVIGVRYALGKLFDDLGQFDKAIEQFDLANEIACETVASNLHYDFDEEERLTDQVIEKFGPSFFASTEGMGISSDLPVLIVGMIRSGTTLLDAQLSSHSEIASAGELTYWEDESLPLLRNVARGVLDPRLVADVAERYRRRLRLAGLKRKRVIDKMPVNYLHAGLIRSALPNARFIHMRRNPIDTCLSIFTTEYGLEPPRFAFDRAKIVHAYRQYLRLMEHWKSVIPADRLIEVDYEDLILDSGPVLRGVLDFLDLPWEDSVLRHEENQAEVATPSRWQARQPVYTSSLARWKNYEPWLRDFEQLKLGR
jgi:tetratricopeptide (TPR) repeat protein